MINIFMDDHDYLIQLAEHWIPYPKVIGSNPVMVKTPVQTQVATIFSSNMLVIYQWIAANIFRASSLSIYLLLSVLKPSLTIPQQQSLL